MNSGLITVDDVKNGPICYPILGDESIMSQKEHGTTEKPVMSTLLYGCDTKIADKICSFTRSDAEDKGYAFEKTNWVQDLKDSDQKEVTYYDSVSGKPLFVAPRGRSMEEFLEESKSHGWPSFRDQEVCWENVRCINEKEAVSVDGTHLGHNIPDDRGNRYCINLVSISG